MSPRYLVGPVSPARARDWHHARSRGECLCFGPAAGEGIDLHLYPSVTWEELLAALPARWRPDFVALNLAIDNQLHWEGYFRFLCPSCGEMLATVNPRNNLAHCFCCRKNLNNIDLLLTEGHTFRSAVALLERLLEQYQAQQAKRPARSSHR